MNFLNFSATFKKPIKPLSDSKEYSSGHLFSIHKKYVAHRCATDLYRGQTISFQNLLLAGLLSFRGSLVSLFYFSNSKICITLLMLGPPVKSESKGSFSQAVTKVNAQRSNKIFFMNKID